MAKKNPDYDKDRYSATKQCHSRSPEARKKYRKDPECKAKQARYMKLYRQRKKLESGQAVRCTKFDIDLKTLTPGDLRIPEIRVSVGCTKFDNPEKPLLTGGLKGQSSDFWSVRCTKLVR